MKDFRQFINENKVKKITPDKELAESLVKNASDREQVTLKLNTREFSLLVFENLYDCLRELLDVILVLEGYKSYSHEAAIAHLKDFQVPEQIISTLDRFRLIRNNSKYYGKPPSQEDAIEMVKFHKETKEILRGIIRKIKQ